MTYNGYPNRETYEVARFLSAWKYSYCIQVTLTYWRQNGAQRHRSLKTLLQVAAKFKRDLTAHAAEIRLKDCDRPVEDVPAVDWEFVAERWLRIKQDYEPQRSDSSA